MIMCSEQEMIELIVGTARQDERIRAVILNGSRANPNAPRDIFQDYDIVHIVTSVEAFKGDPDWIKRFGDRRTEVLVTAHFDFDYPYGDDERVSAHLKSVNGRSRSQGH